MYIVSACLLGENVKYSGGNNFTEAVVEFLKDKEFIPVCPEVLGGLTIPREPCERLGDRVISKSLTKTRKRSKNMQPSSRAR